MLSVNGYYKNGVCVPTETLELKDEQRVIITVLDDSSATRKNPDKNQLRKALDSFRGKSDAWSGMNPVDYQRKIREEREIAQTHIS